jgi:hypothetical protein
VVRELRGSEYNQKMSVDAGTTGLFIRAFSRLLSIPAPHLLYRPSIAMVLTPMISSRNRVDAI